MRETARGLVEATLAVASSLATILQAALMPIDKFVDWLEGVFAGPVGPDQFFSRTGIDAPALRRGHKE
jgi:hypothetical protein